jgi:hypothetical protein
LFCGAKRLFDVANMRIGKSARERAEAEQMAEAVAKYDGPITQCRPGIARGHEALGALAMLAPNRANRQRSQSEANERHEQTTA